MKLYYSKRIFTSLLSQLIKNPQPRILLSISISSAGGVARDRVDAALPQLPQKSSSGWSFSPHFLQNIVALPLSVYANAEYNMGTLLQQKRRAVQV